MNHVQSNKRGELAIMLGAGVWGLFWIPLHYLNDNQVTGLWAVALLLASAVPISLGMALWKREFKRVDFGTIALIGSMIGAASTLYFAALVYSDVIRVVFLFYLLPIWATLIARLLHGEAIGLRRVLAIILALVGLWQLLGSEGGWPVPQNMGDWMAIVSGLCWAMCLAMLKNKPDIGAFASTAAPFIFGVGFAISAALLLNDAPVPTSRALTSSWFTTLLFGTLLLWPSVLGQVWGARLVPAPRAALLTMTEILVATISAYWLIGTSMSARAMLGGALIIIAVLVDLTVQTTSFKETKDGQRPV